MKTLDSRIGMLLGSLLALTLGAGDVVREEDQPTVVVGTFDSRAVAVAYIRSDAFNEYLRGQQADIERAIERARSAGDRELLTDLEALGPAMQQRTHHQGFGNAPVDDILARIEDELPGIAQEAGVDVIVSKWSLAYRAPAAALVDVTELLVAEFEPDERTLRMIRELCETEPVPLDQISEDH